jgi:fatty-acyl-CoA synthase
VNQGPTTFADLLLALAEDDRPGLLHEDGTWTFREVVAQGRLRAALYEEIHQAGKPPHIGVLLDNAPDYLFWLVAAALSGSVIVGINSTYRGAQLTQLIEHSDCEMLVTSQDLLALIEDAPLSLPVENIVVIDDPAHVRRLATISPFEQSCQLDTGRPVSADDLFLLIFTSGSTGLPKAVRCTQGRIARAGAHVASIANLATGDVVYSPLPFFHSSSLFTGWSSAINAGVPIATRRRFSASRTIEDVHRYGATMMTYTGKVLNYILAVPPTVDDADLPLRLAIGNEASLQDITSFAHRFNCAVRDSYGSTEGVVIIRRDPTMPSGALGQAAESVRVLDPETNQECPRAEFDQNGRVINLDLAVGEIVETQPTAGFEGYYKNEAAARERFRDGCYWSGDLAYRDAAGWFYFAGRSNEWLRVDGENFSAGPVEAIIARHPDIRSIAVYAVPDDPVGDRVMVAIELRAGTTFDPSSFDEFLSAQRDLGPKWLPAFVRVDAELPKLASMKLDKTRLRREAWRCEQVVWRPAKGQPLRPLTDADRHQLEGLLG